MDLFQKAGVEVQGDRYNYWLHYCFWVTEASGWPKEREVVTKEFYEANVGIFDSDFNWSQAEKYFRGRYPEEEGWLKWVNFSRVKLPNN